MGAITRAANHLTVEQVKEKLKEAQAARQLQRWLIVYTALMAPRKAAEIAVTLGVSRSLVHKVISLSHAKFAHARRRTGLFSSLFRASRAGRTGDHQRDSPRV